MLDLGGPETNEWVCEDIAFLTPIFGPVLTSTSAPQHCEVLFVYAQLAAEGSVVGCERSLREIIRDCGALVVVVASPNPPEHYVRAGRMPQPPYGRANLVMTLDRRGPAFGRFFSALFTKMRKGTSMPLAWVELNPQAPGVEFPENPGAIFACEIGQLAFG